MLLPSARQCESDGESQSQFPLRSSFTAGSTHVRGIAAGMQHPKDQDVIAVQAIEHAVGKSTHPRPPHARETIDRRRALRERNQPIGDAVQLIQEPILKILTDRVVMVTDLTQIADRQLGESNRHLTARKSARTWSQSRICSGLCSAWSSAAVSRRRSSSLGT